MKQNKERREKKKKELNSYYKTAKTVEATMECVDEKAVCQEENRQVRVQDWRIVLKYIF